MITQEVINPAFLATLDSAGVSELREVVTWSINISAAVLGGIYVWGMIESIRKTRHLKQKVDIIVYMKKENEMNLIDKYIAEVGKHLLRKQRADIEAEIRSTLEDMIDERKQAKGAASEAQVIELAGTPLDDPAGLFVTLANLIPTLVLTIVIIVSSIDVAQMVYKIMKSRPSSPYPVLK